MADSPDTIEAASAAGASTEERLANALRSLACGRHGERALAEVVEDFVYVLDDDVRVRYCNPAGYRWLDKEPAEVIGKRPSELFGPVNGPQMERNVRLVLETGRAIFLERQLPAGRGARWLDVRLIPFAEETGRLSVLGISRDITVRKQAEQQLRETADYLHTLIRQSHDAIVVVDAEGRFEFGNQAFFRMFGWPRKELIGEHFLKVVPADQHEFMLRRWQEVQAGRGAPYEADVLGKDGRRRHVLVSHRHMTTGGHRKYCVVVKDVTERQQAERALAEHRDRLEEVVRRRTEELLRSNEALVREVAERKRAEQAVREGHRKLADAREQERRRLARELHDSIGQQMVAAKLTVQNILAELPAADTPPEATRMLSELSEGLNALVGSVRRLSHGLYPPALSVLGLPAALRQLADSVPDSVTIAVTCRGDADRRRFTDYAETALFRIAQEALSNAVRHGQATRVDLYVFERRGRLCLTVIDDGKGFDPSRAAGVGLGLTSMTDRAEALDGRLTVDSRPGRTSIRARIPLHATV